MSISFDLEEDVLEQLKNSCFDNEKMINALVNVLIKRALESEKVSILVK